MASILATGKGTIKAKIINDGIINEFEANYTSLVPVMEFYQ